MQAIVRSAAGVRALLGREVVRRDVFAMRFRSLVLAFFCSTAFAAIPSPPAPPPGLTTRQASVWNDWTKAPGFKNIWVIQFDKSILLSNSITLDVNGSSYRLDGKSSRLKPFLVVDEKGRRMVEGISWSGQSAEGSGTMTQTTEGEFGGSFTLRKVQVYNVIGADGVTFLVELDQTPPKSAEPALSAASAPTARGEAACSAVNSTTQSPRESVLFGPGSEDRLSSVSKDHLTNLAANKFKTYPLYVNRLAVDSNVILVDIDGERYRFVGTNQCLNAPPMDFWRGKPRPGSLPKSIDRRTTCWRCSTLVIDRSDSPQVMRITASCGKALLHSSSRPL